MAEEKEAQSQLQSSSPLLISITAAGSDAERRCRSARRRRPSSPSSNSARSTPAKEEQKEDEEDEDDAGKRGEQRRPRGEEDGEEDEDRDAVEEEEDTGRRAESEDARARAEAVLFSASLPALSSTASPALSASVPSPPRPQSASASPAAAAEGRPASPSQSLLARLFRGRSAHSGPAPTSAAAAAAARSVGPIAPSLVLRSPSWSSRRNPLCPAPSSPTSGGGVGVVAVGEGRPLPPERHASRERWFNTAPLPLLPEREGEAQCVPDEFDASPSPSSPSPQPSSVDVRTLAQREAELVQLQQRQQQQQQSGADGPFRPTTASQSPWSSERIAAVGRSEPPAACGAGAGGDMAGFACRSLCSVQPLMCGVLLKRAEQRASFVAHLFVLASPRVLLYFEHAHSARPIGALRIHAGSLRTDHGQQQTHPQHFAAQQSAQPSALASSGASSSPSPSPSPSPSFRVLPFGPSKASPAHSASIGSGGSGSPSTSASLLLAAAASPPPQSSAPGPSAPSNSGRLCFSVVADGVSWRHGRLYPGRRYQFQCQQSEAYSDWLFVLRSLT